MEKQVMIDNLFEENAKLKEDAKKLQEKLEENNHNLLGVISVLDSIHGSFHIEDIDKEALIFSGKLLAKALDDMNNETDRFLGTMNYL